MTSLSNIRADTSRRRRSTKKLLSLCSLEELPFPMIHIQIRGYLISISAHIAHSRRRRRRKTVAAYSILINLFEYKMYFRFPDTRHSRRVALRSSVQQSIQWRRKIKKEVLLYSLVLCLYCLLLTFWFSAFLVWIGLAHFFFFTKCSMAQRCCGLCSLF